MKYCSKCGKELMDEAVMCPGCGCAVENIKAKQSAKETLRLIAYIFMLLSCVGCAFAGFIYLIGGACTTAVLASGTISGSISGVPSSPSLPAEAVIFGPMFIVLGVVCLVPLSWIIPMTKKLSSARKNNTKLTTAFKICTLIFVNFIAGILLLCDED